MSKSVRKKTLILSVGVLLLAMIVYTVYGGYRNMELRDEEFSIEYVLVGGIVGFMDKATINSRGEFKYITRDKVISEGVLDKSDIDKIRRYAILDNNFILNNGVKKDTKIYPDMLTEKITVSFKDKVGTTKKSNEIIELIKKYKNEFKK